MPTHALTLMSLVLLAACGPPEPGPWVPTSERLTSVVVTASLDGEEVACLVDTGSSGNVLRTDLAGGVERPEVGVRLSGLDTALGFVSRPEVDTVLDSLELAGIEVDCVLGTDLFEEHALTIDAAEHRLRISPSRAAPTDAEAEPLVFTLDAVRPGAMLRIETQGVSARVLVDSGSSLTLLMPDVFDQLADPPETRPQPVVTTTGTVEARRGVLSELEVDGVPFADVPFLSYDNGTVAAYRADGFELDGLLGQGVLSRGVVTLDTQQRTMWLELYSDDIQQAHMEELEAQ